MIVEHFVFLTWYCEVSLSSPQTEVCVVADLKTTVTNETVISRTFLKMEMQVKRCYSPNWTMPQTLFTCRAYCICSCGVFIRGLFTFACVDAPLASKAGGKFSGFVSGGFLIMTSEEAGWKRPRREEETHWCEARLSGRSTGPLFSCRDEPLFRLLRFRKESLSTLEPILGTSCSHWFSPSLTFDHMLLWWKKDAAPLIFIYCRYMWR